MKRKIYARKLVSEHDFFHLAKEFYRYIYRYPELEVETDWKAIKKYAEEFIVSCHYHKEKANIKKEDYRDFLRFYTELETKYYDEERIFVFTKNEKEHFLSLMQKMNNK